MGEELSRRAFLTGGTATLGAAALVAAAGAGGVAVGRATAPEAPAAPDPGAATVPFHGARQAGIDTLPQSYLTLAALDLVPGADRDAVVRLMRIWADDAARLAAGQPALADTEPELAPIPARLTVTVGWGPRLFDVAGIAAQRPNWLKPLPAFAIDRLEDRWSHGDVVLQICADDQVTVAHAARILLRGAREMASVRWVQHGFRRAVGTEPTGTTMRNLMGQVDGTRNPDVVAEPDLLWSTGSDGWLAGGTSMVVRRVAINLDTWDELDRGGKEAVMGRRLSNGAPLTGTKEFDEPDLKATNDLGFTVIDTAAHIRRARTDDLGQRFLRRGYNYDDAPAAGQVSDCGLVFITFQADVVRQFVPIQERLAEVDLLNTWTTPVGSAVFAIPPGCDEGGYWGQHMLS